MELIKELTKCRGSEMIEGTLWHFLQSVLYPGAKMSLKQNKTEYILRLKTNKQKIKLLGALGGLVG